MQQSLESASTSEDMSLQRNNHYKERALDLMNKTEVCEKDLVEFSLELRMVPEIEVQTNEKLFVEDDFEMLKKQKLNPIFVLNLLNIINIANFLWNATKKTAAIFHRVLLELNIIFSYLQNGEQIEYALLSTIPLHFYEMIVEKGKNCFKNEYHFDEDYLSSDRNKTQIGLIYEESTISHLNSLLDDKQNIAPKIMYYIKHDTCKRLFGLSIFNRPENFLNLKNYTYNTQFHGYNEIDYSFSLKEDVELNQNFILNKVMDNDKVKKSFNPGETEKIKLSKNTNIFVEIKSSFNSPSLITDLTKVSDRFANAYKNLAYDDVEKKFVQNKREYYLLYNNKREDALYYLPKNSDNKDNEQTLTKNTKVIYNSNYVQIASIVSLQNQIRSINYKLDIVEKEKVQMKENIELKFKEQEDKIGKLELQNKILPFKIMNQVTLKAIQKFLENGKNKPRTYYKEFNSMNKKYGDLCSKILDKDNIIINAANKVIGLVIFSADEIQNLFYFLDLINEKISNNTFVSCYYQAFKDMLLGTEWKASNARENLFKFNLSLKDEVKLCAKAIFKFIVMLELDKELENHFFEAVLFYITQLEDNIYNTVFYLCLDPNDVKKTTINVIKILNNQLHESLIPKLK